MSSQRVSYLLKRVARIVHPDKVTAPVTSTMTLNDTTSEKAASVSSVSAESAKRTNERSLAALHAWVRDVSPSSVVSAAVDSGSAAVSSDKNSMNTKLTFYVHEDAQKDGSAPEAMQCVEHTMRLPAEQSLCKLLHALGDTDVQVSVDAVAKHDDPSAAKAEQTDASLLAHLRYAGERLRWLQANKRSDAHEHIRQCRAALRFNHNASVRFAQSPRCPDDAATRAQLAETLVKAIESAVRASDALRSAVHGSTFELTDCTGLNASGNLRLRHDLPFNQWEQIIQSTDWVESKRRAIVRNERETREANVAISAGVGMVCCDEHVALSAEYKQLLDAMAAHTFDIDARGCNPDELSAIVLMVLPSATTEHSTMAPWSVYGHRGILTLPLNASLSEIDTFLIQNSHKAAREKQRALKADEDLHRVQQSTMRHLKLRHLHRDTENVDMRSFKRACNRLMQHGDKLRPLLDGLPVRISDANRTGRYSDANGNLYVDIKYDFSL